MPKATDNAGHNGGIQLLVESPQEISPGLRKIPQERARREEEGGLVGITASNLLDGQQFSASDSPTKSIFPDVWKKR